MRIRSTIVWIVVFLLLGGFAYYFEFVVEKERKETEEKAKQLFGFETYQIRELKLTRSGKTIHCVKGEGNAWNIIEPVQGVADESVVEDVLNGLAAARIERVLSEKIDDPATFGFDKPQYEVECKSKDKTYHLLLGKKNPTDYFYYAKYNGKLLLIPYSISYSLNKELFEFRDKTVISVNTKQTSALEIESGGVILKLVRQAPGGWKVIQPKTVDAGTGEVDKYITSVSLLRVTQFMEKYQSDPEVTGLDSPSLAIRLTVGENKTEKTLLIGKKVKDRYYARLGSGDEVFQLKALDVDNLKYSPDDFRSKQIFSFDKEDVQAIELEHSGITLVMKKVENKWELEKPERGPAKDLFVSELLSDILDLRVEKFLDPAAGTEYGYDRPSIKITLRFEAEKEAALLVGSKVEENVYVQVGPENYLVSAADVEQLKRDPGHFQESVKTD